MGLLQAECPICKAVIIDEEGHRIWHNKLILAIDDIVDAVEWESYDGLGRRIRNLLEIIEPTAK